MRSDSSPLPARSARWAIQLVSEPTPKVSPAAPSGSRGSGPSRRDRRSRTRSCSLAMRHLPPRGAGGGPGRGSSGRHRHARPRSRAAGTRFAQDKAKPCPGASPAPRRRRPAHLARRAATWRPRQPPPALLMPPRGHRAAAAPQPGRGRPAGAGPSDGGGVRGSPRPGQLRAGKGRCCLAARLLRLLFHARAVREFDGGGTPWMRLPWSVSRLSWARTGSGVPA